MHGHITYDVLVGHEYGTASSELGTDNQQLESRNNRVPTYPQGLEEPLVLASCVAVLKELLDGLLGILSLRRLLEGIDSHRTLETLQLKGISCREQVRVVDNLTNAIARQYPSHHTM